MDEIQQYYAILELQPNASQAEVKQAYRKLAKLWHPDRFHDDLEQQKKAEEKFKIIVEAYEFLKDYQVADNYWQNSPKIKTQKSNPDIHYQQGVTYAEQEQYQEAIEEFSRVIRLDGSYIKAYQYRGFILSKLGYENRAESDLKKAKELQIKQNYKNSASDFTNYQTSSKKETKQQPEKTPSTTSEKSTSVQSEKTPSCKAENRLQLKWIIGGKNQVFTSVSLSPTGNILASSSLNKIIKLWNLKTKREIRTLQGHKSAIRCLKFSPDGKFLVSGSDDKTIQIWNLNNFQNQILGTWKDRHTQSVLSIDISPDGKIVVSSSADKTIKIWELNSKREPYTLTGDGTEGLAVAISPNGEVFVSGGLEKALKIRQIDNGKLIRSIQGNCAIASVAFSPDNQIIATGEFDGMIRLWDWSIGAEIGKLKGHSEQVSSIVFSPGGKELISGSLDKIIKIWKLDTHEEIGSFNRSRTKILSVNISQDGKTLVSGHEDNSINIFKFDLAYQP